MLNQPLRIAAACSVRMKTTNIGFPLSDWSCEFLAHGCGHPGTLRISRGDLASYAIDPAKGQTDKA